MSAVLIALIRHRRWTQADLAREVGIRTEALRKVLQELAANGVPLTSDKDHPHVYWRTPPTWFPGAVLFKQEDVPDLLRQLQRLARSKVRDRLLGIVTEQLSILRSPPQAPVVTPKINEPEELYASLVEDAGARKIALAMNYLTASRSQAGHRHASVHLVEIGPPMRFIATCHRNGDLRWFRVDGILRARLDDGEPFRHELSGAVAGYRAASLDGFKGDGPPVEYSFIVRQPEASWVSHNLLEGMTVEWLHDAVRIRVATSAVIRLARFVVGLGAAAECEDAVLREAVADLARGAVEQLAPPVVERRPSTVQVRSGA